MLEIETVGNVRYIRMNRPELHNAFNEELIQIITESFAEIHNNPEIRAVVLSASGKSFSAGADLLWMQKMIHYTQAENQKDALCLADMFESILLCPVPVIGRIQGAALGGGAGLVAACDFALAVGSANFGFTEVKLGLIPAVIAPFVVRKIGVSAATRYFLSGERFDASEALRLGLIHECFGCVEQLDERMDKLLKDLSKNSPQALKSVKSMLYQLDDLSWKEKRQKTTELIAALRVSPQGQEGLTAFLEKRPPSWQTMS